MKRAAEVAYANGWDAAHEESRTFLISLLTKKNARDLHAAIRERLG